ncbi:hypothetical protein [Microseira wollei]|uniref:hypothetical protein n=1 Tax=Microseira wollei TaxID=467598 RepID=UPI001CFC5445|nr:hypothetical protein [Microseira wollei]
MILFAAQIALMSDRTHATLPKETGFLGRNPVSPSPDQVCSHPLCILQHLESL